MDTTKIRWIPGRYETLVIPVMFVLLVTAGFGITFWKYWEQESALHAEVLSKTVQLTGSDRIRIMASVTQIGNGTCAYLTETYTADGRGLFVYPPESKIETSACR